MADGEEDKGMQGCNIISFPMKGVKVAISCNVCCIIWGFLFRREGSFTFHSSIPPPTCKSSKPSGSKSCQVSHPTTKTIHPVKELICQYHDWASPTNNQGLALVTVLEGHLIFLLWNLRPKLFHTARIPGFGCWANGRVGPNAGKSRPMMSVSTTKIVFPVSTYHWSWYCHQRLPPATAIDGHDELHERHAPSALSQPYHVVPKRNCHKNMIIVSDIKTVDLHQNCSARSCKTIYATGSWVGKHLGQDILHPCDISKQPPQSKFEPVSRKVAWHDYKSWMTMSYISKS